jgi:hypothetical protein
MDVLVDQFSLLYAELIKNGTTFTDDDQFDVDDLQ